MKRLPVVLQLSNSRKYGAWASPLPDGELGGCPPAPHSRRILRRRWLRLLRLRAFGPVFSISDPVENGVPVGLPRGLDSPCQEERLPSSRAHGPNGASVGAKAEGSGASNRFRRLGVGFFGPDQAATAAVSRLIR
jgi:hypothetical protein